jgi:cysteine-S-conjugate beta-lyase
MKKDTKLGHAGRDPKANHGIVNPPVYHASTVTFETVAELKAAEQKRFDIVYYGRYGTPTTFAFEEAVATLEGADRCIAMPSGLGAIAGTLMALLKSGDHLLMTDSVYFPARKFCDTHLKQNGIETTYYNPLVGSGISELIQGNTRVCFTETPGSISFEVQDVPTIAKAAHERDVLVVTDNTWSGGYYYAPFDKGADVSIQAATKYIVGHSDAMLGTISMPERFYKKIKTSVSMAGYAAAPDDCYLGLRGIRTLSTRLAQHQETALTLARWLEARPEVDVVLHPALPSCPGHEVWKRDFTGSSGLFGLVLKDGYSDDAVAAMLDGLDLYAMGFSWGGFESLIIPANLSGSRTASPWPHNGQVLRIHAGLEDVDDLIADLEKGLERLNARA